MTAIIGWIGSVLCVSSILQKNQLRFRTLNLAACVAMVTFNLANASWSMVALNIVVAAINIHQIIILRRDGAAATTATVDAAAAAPHATETVDVAADEQHDTRRELVAA